MVEVMPNWLVKRVELTPDRTALIFEGNAYSFRQVFNKSVDIAGKISALGLNRGSTASFLLSNTDDSVFVLYALQMAGIQTVILNNRLTTDELSWQIQDSNSEILIYEDIFLEKVESIDSDAKLISTQELYKIKGEDPVIMKEYDLQDITTIMYTSGTTGNPKGVMQTYGNHWWSANASVLNLGLHEKDSWLCAVPIFHISGYSILMRSQIYGIPVILHREFDEANAIGDIHRHQGTIMSVVSTMLRRILDELGEERLPAFFRCMLLGGGPAPLPMLKDCIEKEIPVFQTYGMTETASQFATLPPEYSLDRAGSAGKALFTNQIMIVNEAGCELPYGSEGEILVKGPNVTPGYLNREEGKINGWLHTGDIGYIDSEGFLYVLDRRSDLIISGGENIYPAEIEGILLSHPAVADAGVIGVNDDKWGRVPVAFIVRKAGAAVCDEDLLGVCESKLARYKLPKKFYFVDSLPRNAAKKLLRRKLREWLERGSDFD